VFVDLARIGDPSLVAPAVARTLGMTEGGDQSLVERLVIALRPSHLLLVFDNCEHLLTAIAEAVSNLLAECPRLQILATSRAPLRIRGEQELPIEPLPLPSPSVTLRHALDLADNPAVQLFIERARAARPDFQLADSNAAVVASRATSCWRTLGIVEAPGLNGRDGYSRCERL
jgi:predicted ATPase